MPSIFLDRFLTRFRMVPSPKPESDKKSRKLDPTSSHHPQSRPLWRPLNDKVRPTPFSQRMPSLCTPPHCTLQISRFWPTEPRRRPSQVHNRIGILPHNILEALFETSRSRCWITTSGDLNPPYSRASVPLFHSPSPHTKRPALLHRYRAPISSFVMLSLIPRVRRFRVWPRRSQRGFE